MTITDTANIWRHALAALRSNSGQVFLTHIAYAALTVILFTPLTGVLGQLLLRLSGQPALADQDIAHFLLTPLGMAALISFASLLIAILVFEQASLMAIAAGSILGLHVGSMSALYFTTTRVKRIFLFAVRLVVRVLIISLPFLAAAGATFWLLMTDYDINYYLTEKPPVFLGAVTIIGLLLLTMILLLIHKLLAWSFALPLILFSNISPARCFVESKKLTQGQRHNILKIFVTWMLSALLLGAVVVAAIQFLGSILAPAFFGSINLLVIVLGWLVALWLLANILTTTFTSASFSFLLMALYERHGSRILNSDLVDSQQQRRWRMTASGFTLLLISSTTVAAMIGIWLIDDIQVGDNVMIVAHRGASGKAPENTLASIRQAIEDGSDWIEIDVQETGDGEIVAIHDSDLMKLAGVNLKVWESTLKQLRGIDVGSWFGSEFSAERIPTLAQVLEAAHGQSGVIIELKYYGHDQQLEQRVVEIVEQAGMVDDIAIMSLKLDGILKIRSLRPDWIIGLLSAKAIGDLTKLDVDFLAVNVGMATTGFVRRTRSAGKQVYVWTVNDPVTMSRMMSLGVDGIITDEPALARNLITERSNLSSVERLLVHTAVLFGQPVPRQVYRDQSP